jgi:hypothetical protein
MKKVLLSIVVIAVVAIALGSAGFVYAQATPPPIPGTGYGMAGRASHGAMLQQDAPGIQDGILHEDMIVLYAQALGITVDDLNARLANGETMAAIAASRGLTVDQFRALMADTRNQAADQAVSNGALTPAQADWMSQRGAGMAAGGRGMRGSGQAWNANPDSPFYSQTQP